MGYQMISGRGIHISAIKNTRQLNKRKKLRNNRENCRNFKFMYLIISFMTSSLNSCVFFVKAVLDNIAEMKENEIKIEDSMKKLMSDSFKTSFTVKLMEQALALHDRWNMTESAAKQHNERMEQLHENNKTVFLGVEYNFTIEGTNP